MYQGLNDKQVEQRIKEGLINKEAKIQTKSIKNIFKTNICTLFNFLNLFLGLLILIIGSYKNLLFLGTIFFNTTIGIIQEIKSKKIIDKLSLITQNKITVIRNNKEQEINTTDIVKDDLVIYKTGNQIIADSIIIDGKVEVNESLITGEVNPIAKTKDDTLLSGSFIISGKAISKVIHVGNENYTYKITEQAKYIKQTKSEIMKSLKTIIKVISYIIVPLGIIFFIKQQHVIGNTTANSIINTVAALISVIPDGLMLLTSTVMALSVIKLSKHKVLVQELYCIENLARVDTICFDKTGTLTKGTMHLENFIELKPINKQTIKQILYHLDNNNPTMNALEKKFGKEENTAKNIIEFTSERKYSAVTFNNNDTYIIGAPEKLIKNQKEELKIKIDNYIEDYRVLLLAKTKEQIISKIPDKIDVIGIFLIQDEIRKEAKKTIEFFEKNDVDVKIISGDNPKTINKILKQLDVKTDMKCIDTSNLSQEELKNIVSKYNVFGRTTPEQKLTIIKTLQENNHTVAMTGDGVNDVLALKQADCSITLKESAEAARNVSELILLDSNFNSLPKIVKEGRRTINNIERSASLFITKTIYALLLLMLFLFVKYPYPFIPIQLTLTSVFTIGIPSFILALEPNNERVKPNFLKNIIKVAFPTAITIFYNIILLLIIKYRTNIPQSYITTIGIFLIGTTGFIHIYKISKPLNKIRTTLLISMITAFLIAILKLEKLFSLSIINIHITIIYIILTINSYIFLKVISHIFEKYIIKVK